MAEETKEQAECDHGVTFDAAEAKKVMGEWTPASAEAFIMGNPAAEKIRKRWPRLFGKCPKGCGFDGIAYASTDHYYAGDW